MKHASRALVIDTYSIRAASSTWLGYRARFYPGRMSSSNAGMKTIFR